MYKFWCSTKVENYYGALVLVTLINHRYIRSEGLSNGVAIQSSLIKLMDFYWPTLNSIEWEFQTLLLLRAKYSYSPLAALKRYSFNLQLDVYQQIDNVGVCLRVCIFTARGWKATKLRTEWKAKLVLYLFLFSLIFPTFPTFSFSL